MIAVYDRHGRIRAADAETARERAAAAVARRPPARQRHAAAGRIQRRSRRPRPPGPGQAHPGRPRQPPDGYQAQAPLADGNQAHPGDLIRARLNTEIDADGRKLTNRDTLKITAIRGAGVEVRRQRLDGTWTERFWVPRCLPRRQRRARLRRQRARRPGPHRRHRPPPGHRHPVPAIPVRRHEPRPRSQHRPRRHRQTPHRPAQQPYQQATPEAVLKNVMERDAGELSATEAIRQSQEWASGTGHLLSLWTSRRPARHPRRDRPAHHRHGSPETEAQRYQREHSRQALHAALRAASSPDTTSTPSSTRSPPRSLDGARSIASVLHGRLQRLHLPDPGIPATWAAADPRQRPAAAREIAEALDARPAELGHRHAANPQPWLIRRLGILPPGASPMPSRRLRAARRHRRRLPGSRRHHQPLPGRLTRTAPRQPRTRATCGRKPSANWRYPDEAAMWAGMDRGQLEAHTAAAERAQATAPPDVAGQLRATAHAEADARQQAADAQVRSDEAASQPAPARSPDVLASQTAAARSPERRARAMGRQHPRPSGKTATRPPPS